MAAESADKPGILGGAYLNGATWDGPSWAEVGKTRDATPGQVWDFAEGLIRATRAKLFAKTQCDLSTQIVVKADDADPHYQTIFDASCSPDDTVDMMLLDGKIDTEGARGIRAVFLVGSQPQNQDIGGLIYTTFDLKPAFDGDHYPQTVVMGAGSAPTFTTL